MSLFFVNSSENDVEVETPANGSNGSSNQQLSEAHQALAAFWPRVTEEIRKIGQVRLDIKTQALPLARIKKIMKLDEDVKMISAEAPMLFSKAAELFIHELTLRAWVHTEDNKRRTLQRNDIAMAITKYDQFDFLIDIVPRDEVKPPSSRGSSDSRTSMNPDQVHYYFQLAQQHQAALQQNNNNSGGTTQASSNPQPAQTIQVIQPTTGQIQAVTVQSQPDQASSTATQNVAANVTNNQPQVIQIQGPTHNTNAATAGVQLFQQIVTPNGEVQQIPFQLSPQQLQMIRMQVQGGHNQPIIIQAAAPAQAQLIQVTGQQNAGQGPVFLSQATATTTTGNNSGDGD
ncbi:nuclear factor Y-box C [Lycorma delicatula]|uniref:nuclear factor Y-box C n=1 Tax=Lycorma delicatula TaxID=130591 RepID=UPI003F5121D0